MTEAVQAERVVYHVSATRDFLIAAIRRHGVDGVLRGWNGDDAAAIAAIEADGRDVFAMDPGCESRGECTGCRVVRTPEEEEQVMEEEGREAKARASVVRSINGTLAGLDGARSRLAEAERRRARDGESAELEYEAAAREADQAYARVVQAADEKLAAAIRAADEARRARLHSIETELGTARSLVRKHEKEYRELRARLERLLPDVVEAAESAAPGVIVEAVTIDPSLLRPVDFAATEELRGAEAE